MFPLDLLNKLSPENRELIQSLKDDELYAIRAIAKPKIMRKSNFTEKTIEKNITPLMKNKVDMSSACRSLSNKGILELYRAPNNWEITNKGYKVCQFFLELKYREQYGKMNILRRGIVL